MSYTVERQPGTMWSLRNNNNKVMLTNLENAPDHALFVPSLNTEKTVLFKS